VAKAASIYFDTSGNISVADLQAAVTADWDSADVARVNRMTIASACLDRGTHLMQDSIGVSPDVDNDIADPGRGPEPGSVAIVLPRDIDPSLGRILGEAVAALRSVGSLVLDAGAVERMSTPCALILMAVGRAADSDGTSLTIRNASPVFRTALADLGLQTTFNKWMA
jgi:anti-anti-sigma regulatory factor